MRARDRRQARADAVSGGGQALGRHRPGRQGASTQRPTLRGRFGLVRATACRRHLVRDTRLRAPGPCDRLDPGATIAERWELAISDSRTLREVDSNDAVVSLEAIEARDPDTMEYFDIVYFLDRAKDREGRVARAELPLSKVLQRAATDPVTGPSQGELFDRLLENDALRAWIEAQSADGWGDARLQPVIPGAGPAFERVRLEMVSRAFEHSAVVTADADGSNATLDLPGEEDRTRVFARTAGTLPPGIQALPDATWVVTDDLQFGTVLLPSGRLVVDEFPLGAEPLDIVVAPGAYATHATLARRARPGGRAGRVRERRALRRSDGPLAERSRGRGRRRHHDADLGRG